MRWTHAEEERLTLAREMVSKVSVRDEHRKIEFWVWSDADGLRGQLIIHIGETHPHFPCPAAQIGNAMRPDKLAPTN